MRILLIDKYQSRSHALAAELALDTHQVTEAHDPHIAADRLLAGPDLVLLVDAGDAIQTVTLLRELRQGIPIGADSGTYVIALGVDGDHNQGRYYQAGADQVLGSKTTAGLVSAAVGAIERRLSEQRDPAAVQPPVIVSGNLTLDGRAAQVRVDGADIYATKTEFRILATLASRPNEVIPRNAIEQRVFGYVPTGPGRSPLDAHIARLRRRLSASGADCTVHNVHGRGYGLLPVIDPDTITAPTAPGT